MTLKSNLKPAEAHVSPFENGSDVTSNVDSGSIVRPMFGQSVSGDAAFTVEVKGGLLGVIVDVLGHGLEANNLAVRMQEYLVGQASGDVGRMLSRMHEEFRGSRGAALGLCLIESANGRTRFAGIGNTVIRRFGESETRLVSRNGVVGGIMPTPIEGAMQLSFGDTVVMYTDGVKAHFDASDYLGIRNDPPCAVAANIVDRFGKSHDDAACVVMRYQR